MNKQNLKAVYADNNPDWRIVYMPGGTWKLQEYQTFAEGVDRRKNQPWKDHNTNMDYDGAIQLLATHNIFRASRS